MVKASESVQLLLPYRTLDKFGHSALLQLHQYMAIDWGGDL